MNENPFKLLVIEDNEVDLETFRDTVEVYIKTQSKSIELVEVKSMKEAIDIIDNTFDGVLVDLKLSGEGYEGNYIVSEIKKKYRIPVAILTGTPENTEGTDEIPFIGVYTKGLDKIVNIIDAFFNIYNTGLTKIMGGRGKIEEAMDKIFWNNILKTIDAWKNYTAHGLSSEKALSRYVLTHLYEFLGDDDEKYLPEEMYIFPPISKNIKTGSIVKKKDCNDYYIILSPACDLAIHNNNIKTDRILLCLIEKTDMSLIKSNVKKINADDNAENKEKATQMLNKITSNNYCAYYHYLPPVKFFDGGIINFRKVETFKLKDFKANFDKPHIQTSTLFIRDIVSRFSTYYARQGQPDFKFTDLTDKLIEINQSNL